MDILKKRKFEKISMEVSKKADDWFGKIQKYVSEKIGAFVAFLFLLFAAGALVAIHVMNTYPEYSMLVVLGPATAGLIAYYNRAFAAFAFIILMIFLLFI